jgi:hypothetical protein
MFYLHFKNIRFRPLVLEKDFFIFYFKRKNYSYWLVRKTHKKHEIRRKKNLWRDKRTEMENRGLIQYLPEVWKRAREAYVKIRFHF